MTQSQNLTPAELIKEQEDQRLFAEWCDFIEEKNWDYYTQSLYLEEFVKEEGLFAKFLAFARERCDTGI